MNYIIAGLAVYKFVHILDAISPRNAMPWVKILVSTVVSYVAVALLGVSDWWIAGLAVATIASACHGVMRMITLLGDLAYRKSIK
jgi:hypothetical protein